VVVKMKKVCVIIGAQKAGTTSLFRYLSQHPQISSSKVKETNFFVKDEYWNQGIDYYESLWSWNSDVHSIALEASPNYTYYLSRADTVIQRIQSLNLSFKFIYILRDPIEKIQSMRQQGVHQGWYRKTFAKETPTSIPPEAIVGVRYATIADKFVDAFSRDSLLLLKTDALPGKGKDTSMMKEICEFLEVDTSFQFDIGTIHNARNSYRDDTVLSKMEGFKITDSLKALIPSSFKKSVRGFLATPINRDSVTPFLTDAQKEYISSEVEEELLTLELKYGLDLADWKSRKH